MNRKKLILPLLLMLVALVVAGLGVGINSKTTKLKANSLSSNSARGIDDLSNPDNPTRWHGEHAQVGKLRFGLVEGSTQFTHDQTKYTVGTPSVELVPNDAYVNGEIKESKVIRHIFDAQLYKIEKGKIIKNTEPERFKRNIPTSYGLVIMETDAQNARKNGFVNPGKQSVMFLDGTVSGGELSASGTTQADFEASSSPSNWDTWNVEFKMTASADNSSILHSYTMTNKSSETKTFTPIKQVDTQLDYNDFVQIFSRGPGKGVYIETYEDSLPNDVRPQSEGRNARLDYIINPNRDTDPVQYSGNGYAFIDGVDKAYVSGLSLFGELGATTRLPRVEAEMSAKEGDVLFGWDGKEPLTTQNAIDTAIYLNWGQKTLPPHESVTMTYEVGMKELTKMDLDKTYENINNNPDGKNYVGDEIKYDIKVGSPEYQVNKLVVTDKLSWNFEKPDPDSIVSVTSGKNSPGTPVTTYKMSEVFEENPNPSSSDPYVGTLTIPKGGASSISLDKGKEYHYTFNVKLAPSASDQNVLNKAIVTGETPDYQKVFGDAETKTPLKVEKVPDIGKVIIKYQDTAGNKIADDDEVTGEVGKDKYDLRGDKKLEIDGYKFKEYVGEPTGDYTVADQTVILKYDEHFFNLTQKVEKTGGASALTVFAEDELDYTIKLESLLKNIPNRTYKDFTISGTIIGEIENVKEMKLATAGKPNVSIGTLSYDSATGAFNAKLPTGIGSHESLLLTYKGKVKSTAVVGKEIVANVKASGSYSDNLVASEVTATPVISIVGEGGIYFESAPGKMNFGTDIHLSSVEKTYPLVSKDKELKVKDLRGPLKEWSVVAKATKVLTNPGSSNHELPNALYYKRNNVDHLMTLNKTIFVKNHVTTSAEAVDLSKVWENDTDKPFVKIKGGEARKGAYEGTIEWNLRMAPSDETNP